jgi:hypothetical protein
MDRPAATMTPQQWEYRVVPIHRTGSLLEARLNQLGLEGWELVHLDGAHELAVFKRPRPPRPTPPPDEAHTVHHTH